MTGAGLDLISACLAVSLFNLAVCLSYGAILLVSVPMDETFSATAILQLHIWLSKERPVSGAHLTCMDAIWMMRRVIGLQLSLCGMVTVSVLVCSLNNCQHQTHHIVFTHTVMATRRTLTWAQFEAFRGFILIIYDFKRNSGDEETLSRAHLK